MKYLLILTFLSTSIYANDLSYKNRSDEGESKYERIGKMENYVSKLSGNLEKIHSKMKKDFDKKLKKLEEKLNKSRKSELLKATNSLSKSIDKLNDKVSPLLKDGSMPAYALAKEAKGIQVEVDIHKDRLTELIAKLAKLELQIKDLTE